MLPVTLEEQLITIGIIPLSSFEELDTVVNPAHLEEDLSTYNVETQE
ncbi:hypothetical protein P12053L_06 [Celeribacter phage P12053L]|uniref:Uncharacterized protein n=1 Tax=Celeribacter phage P12053L TaxID=1197951 RepID=I6R0X9_9CAUD|nr:hypothetical protein B622_gp06 [Celeribacter phage P12053L]AFM54611.1 hypothetical protein P12053L_06 [Celeribacter phage P12053L]